MMKTAVLLSALCALVVRGTASYGIASRQDQGGYSFAYQSATAGQESWRRAGDVTRGSYSYVEPNSLASGSAIAAFCRCTAKGANSEGSRGFMVTARDVLQAAPEPVRDTPEVAQAKADHLAAVARAKALASSEYAPQPVEDTPEVAAARARHLGALQDVHGRGWTSPGVYSQWSTAAPPVAAYRSWTPAPDTSVPVQDTQEVAAAKAKHLAAVEEAKARVSAAGVSGYVPPQARARQYSPWAASEQAPVNPAVPIQDTAEVAAAKAKHLAAVAEAQARVSASQTPSIASQYVSPTLGVRSSFHYPNVPDEFPRWVVSSTPAPLVQRWESQSAPVPVATWEGQSNDISRDGQYVPDDEGRYIPSNNDEGQYIPGQYDEGQYNPRLNDEGQYIPSQNDEGQWVPSRDEGRWVPSHNEGRYIPGGEHLGGEDNMPYSYSYSDGLTSKSETKTPDGVTRGRYSYLDANGVLQSLEYEADNVHGFRASGTNLPRAPEVPSERAPVAYGTPAGHYVNPIASPSNLPRAPEVPSERAPLSYGVPAGHYVNPIASPSLGLEVPVDTPEVAAAKAAHFAAHREAGARLANAYGG